MSNQPRVARVLAVLLVAMTVAAIVLMALQGSPPSAGPFCLSSYYRLNPVAETVYSHAAQSPNRWSSIEAYCSGTAAGNIEQLASLGGLVTYEDINCHFVICNGLGGGDGQIQPTEKWQKQWSVVPDRNWYGSIQTIRICVIAEAGPTDNQLKRLHDLSEVLCERFEISPENIYYPSNWN